MVGAVVAVVLLFANEPGSSTGSTPASPGAALFAANCASCHGADGGGGVGPQLAGGAVVEQFPSVDDQITFVTRRQRLDARVRRAALHRRRFVKSSSTHAHCEYTPRKGIAMGAEVIVGIIVVAIVVFVVWKSFHSVGPTEVGPGDEAVRLPEALRGQPHRLPRRGRLPGRPADAGLRFKFWIALQGREVPVGAGARRRDRRGHRPGRATPLPIGAKSAVYKPEFGNFTDLDDLRRRTAGRRACSARCCRPARSLPIHPVGFLVITKPKVYGVPVSPGAAALAAPAGACSPPSPSGSQPRPARAGRHHAPQPQPEGVRDHRHGRHRHHLRGRAAALRRHRQPAGRLRRRGRDGSTRGGAHRRRAHRGAARQQEQPAQQLPGLPGLPRQRRQDRPAARPAALRRLRSSTRSWCASSWCRCWSSSRARWR